MLPAVKKPEFVNYASTSNLQRPNLLQNLLKYGSVVDPNASFFQNSGMTSNSDLSPSPKASSRIRQFDSKKASFSNNFQMSNSSSFHDSSEKNTNKDSNFIDIRENEDLIDDKTFDDSSPLLISFPLSPQASSKEIHNQKSSYSSSSTNILFEKNADIYELPFATNGRDAHVQSEDFTYIAPEVFMASGMQFPDFSKKQLPENKTTDASLVNNFHHNDETGVTPHFERIVEKQIIVDQRKEKDFTSYGKKELEKKNSLNDEISSKNVRNCISHFPASPPNAGGPLNVLDCSPPVDCSNFISFSFDKTAKNGTSRFQHIKEQQFGVDPLQSVKSLSGSGKTQTFCKRILSLNGKRRMVDFDDADNEETLFPALKPVKHKERENESASSEDEAEPLQQAAKTARYVRARLAGLSRRSRLERANKTVLEDVPQEQRRQGMRSQVKREGEEGALSEEELMKVKKEKVMKKGGGGEKDDSGDESEEDEQLNKNDSKWNLDSYFEESKLLTADKKRSAAKGSEKLDETLKRMESRANTKTPKVASSAVRNTPNRGDEAEKAKIGGGEGSPVIIQNLAKNRELQMNKEKERERERERKKGKGKERKKGRKKERDCKHCRKKKKEKER
eukprot:MONOS_5097.1-p1 / transcript=MONOS_5097.1 / gene=MONOS_5097 / organism=Monocercomonoides_exilis_PA203 / gene_product=unspecified product / transcript_product=unspecified product / location=Mono_scaffold00144:93722-95581(+) / protein_length=620 / sequence_SO=supercontig / SO=protein_coding / is_pseudo=false